MSDFEVVLSNDGGVIVELAQGSRGPPGENVVTVQKDGSTVGDDAGTLNFTGDGVTVTGDGSTKEVAITGDGGTSGDIADGSVTTEKLADHAVTAEKLADDSVTSRKLAAEAVVEGTIADGAVTARKIPRGAITETQMAADSIGEAQLRADSVNTPEIRDNAVSEAKLDSDTRTKLNRQTGVDNVARRDAGDALAAARAAATTANENRAEISAEETQRRAADQEEERQRIAVDADLANQIANVAAFRGGSQVRVDPPIVPTANDLVRDYTLHIDSLQGIPDTAVKVVVSAGGAHATDANLRRNGNFVLAWDNAWVRTRRTIPLTRFVRSALDTAIAAGNILPTDHSVPVQVGFYGSAFPDNGLQQADIALAFFSTVILIGDSADLPDEFTGRDRIKFDRYAANPRANGAAFVAPLVTLNTMRRVAYSSSAISAGNIAAGTFMIGTPSAPPGAPQGIFARFTSEDAEATGFLESGLRASIGTVETTLNSFTTGAQGWTARVAGDFSAISVGDEVRFSLGPKVPGSSGADLSQVEDFAKVGNPAVVPATKTLGPLFGADSTSFNFETNPQDPTASGSNPTATDTLQFGTAASDTAVTDEVNTISGSSFSLLAGDATHPTAQIIVDCTARDIAIDRFTNLRLILRRLNGTVIATVPMDVDPVSENANMKFSLAALDEGSVLSFAMGATVRGREQDVPVVLSNLRYSRSADAPANPFIREIAQQIVNEEADSHEARDARIEQAMLAGDQTLPAPTSVGSRRSPTWDTAGATHQDQTTADAFVIPASGYAQVHWTGEIGGQVMMHVDEWRIPQNIPIYTDSAGAILLVSDGTHVRLRNRNAAANGAYPNASLLNLGRGFQWFTWPEAAPATGTVTVLTEQQILNLIDAAARAGSISESVKVAWRARVNSSHIGAGGALPALTAVNVGDVYFVTTAIPSGISFADISDPATPLTAAAVGDVLQVHPVRGGKAWLRLGNLITGRAPRRFERDVGASPATLPVGSLEISVKATDNSNNINTKRLLLSQVSATNEKYQVQVNPRNNVGFNIQYAPATRTLTYSVTDNRDTLSIRVIGEE